MAQRATSLGPKPSLFSFCFFVFGFVICFAFFVFNRKTLCFSPKKGILLFIILCFPLFILSLFGASSFFTFFFFVSLVFFSFFLPFCFSFLYLVLAFSFCYVSFIFLGVLLFLFFCLLSCFVLNHNLRFVFALHLGFLILLFFVFVAFIFCYFLIFGNLSKTSLKKNMEILKTTRIKNAEKDILTRAISTGVFTNSVFFLLCVSFNFAFLADNTIKIGVSAKNKNK